MKIKVIDIMNKIHNEENVPKQIKYDMKTYFYDENCQDYTDYDRTYGLFSDLLDKQYGIFSCLNDEVEIIEEEPRDIEVCGSWITKSEYDKLAHSEEEKKIPEKIKDKYCSQISKVELAQKYNEIIDYLDYLKSKGEKMRNKKQDKIFKYNKLLKPICEKLTNHKHRELVGWDESFGTKDNYKYANRHDFYYKCKICGYLYFNHKVSPKDLEYIKEYDKSKGE